jgi:hypothetical protein
MERRPRASALDIVDTGINALTLRNLNGLKNKFANLDSSISEVNHSITSQREEYLIGTAATLLILDKLSNLAERNLSQLRVIETQLEEMNKASWKVVEILNKREADREFEGSIHKLGAKLQGYSACNGWDYWHYEEKGKLVSINKLREKIRNNKKEIH